MNQTKLLETLEQISERLGWQVRYEVGDFRGGYCRVVEQHQVILPKKKPLSVKIDLMLEALSDSDLEQVYMPPEIRAQIEQIKRHTA